MPGRAPSHPEPAAVMPSYGPSVPGYGPSVQGCGQVVPGPPLMPHAPNYGPVLPSPAMLPMPNSYGPAAGQQPVASYAAAQYGPTPTLQLAPPEVGPDPQQPPHFAPTVAPPVAPGVAELENTTASKKRKSREYHTPPHKWVPIEDRLVGWAYERGLGASPPKSKATLEREVAAVISARLELLGLPPVSPLAVLGRHSRLESILDKWKDVNFPDRHPDGRWMTDAQMAEFGMQPDGQPISRVLQQQAVTAGAAIARTAIASAVTTSAVSTSAAIASSGQGSSWNAQAQQQQQEYAPNGSSSGSSHPVGFDNAHPNDNDGSNEAGVEEQEDRPAKTQRQV